MLMVPCPEGSTEGYRSEKEYLQLRRRDFQYETDIGLIV